MAGVPVGKESMMTSLEVAVGIAAKAHRTQRRRGGDPYLLHPLRVMMKQESEDARIVAVLHDVVEDSEITWADLEDAGFQPCVIEALKLLTHEENRSYEEYVALLAPNELARRVKIADLEDNLDLRELPELTERDLVRVGKYHRAWTALVQWTQ